MESRHRLAGQAQPDGLPLLPIAAIVHAPQVSADHLLADFAFALRDQGFSVRGVVQQFRGGSGKAAAVLVDVAGGGCYSLFQKLGAGAGSCSIDEQSLAAASTLLRSGLELPTDLVVTNRFGALEAEGRGFAGEMLLLMAEQVPLLTVVNEVWLDAWRRFTGGAGVELAAHRQAVEAWFSQLRQPAAA